jgi:hypothetical protein
MKKRNYIDEAGHEWPTQSDQGLSKAVHTPTPWKRNWTVWFAGTSKADFIEAYSRKEAIELFAKKEGVNVSSYIQARRSTFIEFKGGF